jgi:catechol 2,3-dioxygenase-like lactoylglutathione lyase family enzyme
MAGWYRDVFGFLPAGGTRFRGPAIEALQGLAGASSRTRWLVEQQEFFQLEMFQFDEPAPRPFARDRAPIDIGYTTIGIHVADFDAVLERLHSAGTTSIAGNGAPGHRRVAVRDPEGVLIEIMEDDPWPVALPNRARPYVPGSVRFVRASVPNLRLATHFFASVLGLEPLFEPHLHRASHESLWSEPGADADSVELAAGDCILELVHHRMPQGRGWPEGYRISDQGLLNIAFGGRSRREYEAVKDRVRASGYPMHAEMRTDFASVVYVEDGQGFSVELLYLEPGSESLAGFEPRSWDRPGK